MQAKRAALYIRVSSDEQAKHGFSIPEQRHDLTEYVNRAGYSIVDVYADEGLTARKSLIKRKELGRLLNDVRAGKIDIIVFKCLDRWIRNVRDYYKIQDILDAHKVDWECTQEEYNTTTTNGRLMLNIKLSVAQNESDQTSDRIRYIQEGKKRRHEALSGAVAIGHKVVNKKIVIDESKADAVRIIFSEFLSGSSMRALPGFVEDRTGIKLTRRQCSDTLRKRSYLGEYYGVPGYVAPLVSQEDFDAAQDMLRRNVRPQRNPSTRPYLFAGLIKCPCCGTTLRGYRGAPDSHGEYHWYHYRCNRRWAEATDYRCDYGSAISEARVERFLVSHVRDLLRDNITSIHRHTASKANLQSQLKSINAKLSRLKDLYVDGLIDKDTYRSDYDQHKADIQQVTAKLAKQKTVPKNLDQLLHADDFIPVYKSLTRQGQRRFWQSILTSITFERKPLKRGTPLDFNVTFRGL